MGYVGEIRAFGFDYASRGWRLCEGALLRVVDNTALYSVIGNTYGGVAGSTFALPDLRGKVVAGAPAPTSSIGYLVTNFGMAMTGIFPQR